MCIRDRVYPVLRQVEKDLKDAGIVPVLSTQIEKDALQKFSFVSPMAAMGACYDVQASDIQKVGAMRATFMAVSYTHLEHMKGSPLCWQITFSADECERSELAMDAIQRL